MTKMSHTLLFSRNKPKYFCLSVQYEMNLKFPRFTREMKDLGVNLLDTSTWVFSFFFKVIFFEPILKFCFTLLIRKP